MKSIVQIISTTKTLLITNASRAIDSGRDIAPTKRSVKATPHSRIFEICFSSLLVFTAIITNRFNRMVTGQAVVVMATVILRWLEIVFVLPRQVLQILFQLQFGLSYQCEIFHRHK